MIETQPTVDNGCTECGGVGFVRRAWEPGRSPRDNGTAPCPACNPAPIEQLAEAENKRAFADGAKATMKRRAGRPDWWAG